MKHAAAMTINKKKIKISIILTERKRERKGEERRGGR